MRIAMQNNNSLESIDLETLNRVNGGMHDPPEPTQQLTPPDRPEPSGEPQQVAPFSHWFHKLVDKYAPMIRC